MAEKTTGDADTGNIGLNIEGMATFCKAKGFIYPTAELYGGLAGFFDFGHLGSELKNNMKQHWWRHFVQSREDVVGIDASIITNPKVWKASGHVDCFEDVMVECSKCNARVRGDHLIEDKLKIQADGLSKEDVTKLIVENNINCKCGGGYAEGKQFNLMFRTQVGPVENDSSTAYLRPETAQMMFTNCRLVTEHARLKLPFGIAQMGRSFRNEIRARDFIFRCREFEQMELEYFIHPDKGNDCPFLDEVLGTKIQIISSDMQEQKKEHQEMTLKEAMDQKILTNPWQAYWLASSFNWYLSLGAQPSNFRIRQHLKDEKSHYAVDTWDLEYKFPFGWKELQGVANRGDFDLKQHMLHSKADLTLYDEETNKKVLPHVVSEPAFGVERTLLVFLFDAYNDDKERGNIVLKLHPKLAPVKVAVLPLVNKLRDKAREVFALVKDHFVCVYDKSGSIGRRYARNDEIGTPYCVTIDFESLDDGEATIRDRDTAQQKRVKIEELVRVLDDLLSGRTTFNKL